MPICLCRLTVGSATVWREKKIRKWLSELLLGGQVGGSEEVAVELADDTCLGKKSHQTRAHKSCWVSQCIVLSQHCSAL